jgi:hypothetical protein
MSRYFFDVGINGTEYSDSEGAEFASLELARNEAFRVAIEIARDELDRPHAGQDLIVSVRDDEAGYRVTLAVNLAPLG